MEFLSLSYRRSSARNVPIGEERGETDVSKFTSTFFLSSSNCTFIVYHKRSLPTPFMLWILTSHFTQPSCTHNNWANHKVHKTPDYQKMLTYILAILLDVRTSFGALIPRRSIQMVNTQWVGQLQCRLPHKRITKKIVQWKLYSERSTVRRGFIKQIHCLTDGNNLLTYANLPLKMHARH